MVVILILFKIHLRINYFFIKLFTRRKKQVFFLSRQFNSVPLNYELLIDKLKEEEPDIFIKTICRKVDEETNALVRNEVHKAKKNYKKKLQYYGILHKQMYYLAQSRVVIIDGYNLPVSILKHKKETTIIQLWHALAAIKQFGYQTIGKKTGVNSKIAKILCMHRNYNYVISGSEAMIRPFSEAFNIEKEKILPIGTPLVDYLLQEDQQKLKKIIKKYPKLKQKKNVLYSPTFRTNDNYSFDELIDNFDYKKYNLVMTMHPKSKIIVNDKRVIIIDNTKYLTFDVLKLMDYVITDYSALAIDALVCNKNVMFYLYDYDEYSNENGLNINLFKEFPLYTSKTADKLLDVLNKDNYNISELKRLRKKYVTKFEGKCTEELVDLIRKGIYEKN